MKTNHALSAFAGMLVVVAAVTLNGCTVMFSSVGALSDISKPNTKIAASQQAATLKLGTPIKVARKDGTWAEGKYHGLARIPIAEYAPDYSYARGETQRGVMLPALGEAVVIQTRTKLFTEFDQNLHGTFQGFAHDRVLTQLKGTAVLSSVPLHEVMQLTNESGRVLSGAMITDLIHEGRAPVMTAIVVESEAGAVQVAMHDVRHLEIPVQKNGALTGLVAGALIDAAIIIAASQVDWSRGGTGSWWGNKLLEPEFWTRDADDLRLMM